MVNFHRYHSRVAHSKAFRKMLVLLFLALLPQWVNIVIGGLTEASTSEFLNLNDTLIYSFSFLAPALLMTYDIFNGKEDSKKSGVSDSYFWIFAIAIILLFINVILYTIQITLSNIDIGDSISIWVNYFIFLVALYIWYTTILYQYFELSPEDFNKKSSGQVQKKVDDFKKRMNLKSEHSEGNDE